MENEELTIEDSTNLEIESFEIPNIYKYKDVTNEYTGYQTADKDPAESKKQGIFVPLVPANSTLLEVPEYGENEIPVYSKIIEIHTEEYEVPVYDEHGNPMYDEHGNLITETKIREIKEVIENWEVKADYRKNFYKVDNDLNVSEITTIGEQEGFIIVPLEIGEDIKEHKDWYKIIDDQVVKKSDEEIMVQELLKAKRAKHLENDNKAEIARENQYFTITIQNKKCTFQTTRKTQQDLSTAKDFIQLTEQPYQWFSDNNEEVYLTLEDVINISTLFIQKANIYPTWSDYETAIEEAQTAEEVESIVIDYKK